VSIGWILTAVSTSIEIIKDFLKASEIKTPMHKVVATWFQCDLNVNRFAEL